MTPRMRLIGIFALSVCTPLAALAGAFCDEDGDGVPDEQDVCCGTPLGVAVDETGRPIGDLDGDCDVDLADWALMQVNFTGPLPPCPPECTDNSECEPDEMCLTENGDCGGAGQCAIRPDICPANYDPVCGCDGITYSNPCEARKAGVNIGSEGVCIPACQENNECNQGEFCAKSMDDCDGSGVCLTQVIDCFVVSPVCGCDGQTYLNFCDAAQAGQNIVHDGPCSQAPCSTDGDCGLGSFCARPEGECEGAGECAPIPDVCTAHYDPVCGCDGETYSNACYASAAGVNVASDGACPQTCRIDMECGQDHICLKENCNDIAGVCVELPQACVQIFAPVCGCDQVTYPNACFAIQAGANIDTNGPCVSACTTNAECGSAGPEYCHRALGDCDGAGVCQQTPVACPLNFDPVCGCDGLTYGNACLASKQGVSIEYAGVCNTSCTGNNDCGVGEYCQKATGDCLGQGECFPSATLLCTDVYDPVCGCDGQSHANACLAAVAGVNVEHEGECCE